MSLGHRNDLASLFSTFASGNIPSTDRKNIYYCFSNSTVLKLKNSFPQIVHVKLLLPAIAWASRVRKKIDPLQNNDFMRNTNFVKTKKI